MDISRSSPQRHGTYRAEFHVCVANAIRDASSVRAVLSERVFPTIRARVHERAGLLKESDPRWEITLSPQHAQRIAQRALDDLYAYRPAFIAVLERGDAQYREPAGMLPWLQDMAGDSAVAFNLVHRVLAGGLMRDRAFFYVLDSRDDPRQGHDGNDRVERIVAQARAAGYEVRENIASPEALADAVLLDLDAVMRRTRPEGAGSTAADRDRHAQEQFAAMHRGGYVEIGAYLERLDDHVLGAGRSVAVCGESGNGKSALLVNWIDHLQAHHPDVTVICRYVGAGSAADDLASVLRAVIAELQEYCGIREPVPDDIDALAGAFASLLAQAPEGRTVVVVVDNVDGLIPGEHGSGWLPQRLPANVRLVVSGVSCAPVGDLRDPAWVRLEIEPLTLAQSRSVVDRVVQLSGNVPAPELMYRVAGNAERPTPFFLRSIVHYAQTADTAPDVVMGIRTVEEVMDRMLERCEEQCGPELTRRALSLIGCARRGLAVPEIRALTGAAEADVQRLVHVLEHYLMDAGGLLSFIHDHVRRAVRQRYGADVSSHHVRLAGYFAAEPPGVRRLDEEPWQWKCAGERERLAACITDIPMFLALAQEERRYELLGYWLALGDREDVLRRYEERLAALGSAGADAELRAFVIEQLGRFCLVAGLIAHAERHLRSALALKSELFGRGDVRIAGTLHDLAELLRQCGRFQEAEELYVRALAIREEQADPLDPAIAQTLSDLALLYRDRGRGESALPLYQRAVLLKERIHGADHPATAESMNDLALLYHDLRDLDAALALNRRALEIRTRRFGAHHPLVATSLNNLGGLYRDMNDLGAAEESYRAALAVREERLGPDHPNTLITLANLASLLHAIGRHAEGRALLERAISATERTLGPDSTSRLAFAISYAQQLRDMGDAASAERLLRGTLDVLTRDPDTPHPYMPACANNLAAILHRSGRDVEALTFYAMALEGWERTLGPGHLHVARALQNMASIHFRQNRPEVAEPLVRRAVAVRTEHLGADHESTAQSVELLASVLGALSGDRAAGDRAAGDRAAGDGPAGA